jgi:HK97 family phage major capsid protein
MAKSHTLLDPITHTDGAEPSLGECLAALALSATTVDSGRRSAGFAAVKRTMSGDIGGGALGGFLIRPEWSNEFWDKARSIDGPLARCTLRFLSSGREWHLPGFSEGSRATGLRWGGISGSWRGETLQPPSTQPAAGDIVFVARDLKIRIGPISRDLLADSEFIAPFLSYAAHSEIRFALEQAMLRSVPSGPTGVLGVDGVTPSRGVVLVPKGTTPAGQILSANIDAMWASLYGPCRRNAIWTANDDTMLIIDQAATVYNWPQSVYLPQGVGGNAWPLLKGRPLLSNEANPVAGSVGDLTLADWSQLFCLIRRPTGGSSLSVAMAPPADLGHLGLSVLPEGSVETLMSDQAPSVFDIDSAMFIFRLRADTQPIWSSVLTTATGATVGWSAVLAAR